MVNKVILIGNLGSDPEIRHLESGASVAKFSLATNENYRDKNGEWQKVTEWHDVVVWRQLAERASQTLKKGDAIYLEGKLSTRKWEDSEGNPRRTTEVVANYFRVLNRREAEGADSASGYAESSGRAQHAQSSGQSAQKDSGSMEADESTDNGGDDLPF